MSVAETESIFIILHSSWHVAFVLSVPMTYIMTDTSVFKGKKARYLTLGCKLNFSETATFAEMLRRAGVANAKDGEVADICIINTCAVTGAAAAKCRQAISKMVRQNKGAYVVVTGCYAQLEPDTVMCIKGVSLVLGNNEKAKLMQYLSVAWSEDTASVSGACGAVCHTVKTREITSFTPSCSRGNRTRYFLKVQDGCSYYCTYCAIPFARGRSRNPSIASLVEQAEQASREGGREIVLTGVNIGDFGRSTGESFLDLVKALDNVKGIDRFRISSLEPDLISDELIEFCAKGSRAFMPHFHIPLQSGSDEVLRLMRRRYDKALFSRKVALIKKLIPHAFIGVDVMAGCRGETPGLFEECYDFVKSLDVSKLLVFPYSERPGTAALQIFHTVDEREKRRRTNLLLALSEEKQHNFYASFIGTERPVLFEKSVRGGVIHGFTDNYVRVELSVVPPAEELDNTVRLVRMTKFNTDGTTLKCVLK